MYEGGNSILAKLRRKGSHTVIDMVTVWLDINKDYFFNVLLRSIGREPDELSYRENTAFLDRMQCYFPGWEVPKFRPEHFTEDLGRV